MANPPDTAALAAALHALAGHGVVPDAARRLEPARDDFREALEAAVTGDVAAYRESGNPDVVPELREHLDEHAGEILRLMGGGRPGDFGFVARHAGRRAGQRFPLEALLHTYRCVHKVFSVRLRDAALEAADSTAHVRRVVAAVADLAIEYTDAVSTTATSAYVEQTRLQAEAEGDRRIELLNLLLSGYDESDSRAAQLLRRSGYLEQRQSYCVVVARSVDPKEMANPARAQRMAAAIGDALSATPQRTLIGIRDQLVIAVVSGTRRLSGWTAPQSLLADRLYPALRTVGPAALIGLSNDAPSTSHIPRAGREARLALDFASVADRVMPCSRVPLRKMLVAQAGDRVQAALPGWLDHFGAADRKSRGALGATLRAYADSDMNVLRAARQLDVHPNTIYARAQRIADITGKNPLAYHDLTELLLAIDCRG